MNLSATTRRWLAVIAVVLAVSVVGLWLYGRGGGPLPARLSLLSPSELDPLAASGSGETVLRTVRLAGFERAVVGAAGDSATLRIEVPVVTTGADLEIAWQTSYAALTVAYPDASEYVVQVFESDYGIIELVGQGSEIRTAVSAGNASALRAVSEFTFLRDGVGMPTPSDGPKDAATTESGVWDYILKGLRGGASPFLIEMPGTLTSRAGELADAAPIGARSLPGSSSAINRDVSGAYLDAKNAAAGLVGTVSIKELRDISGTMRDAVGGIPAPEPGQAMEAYVNRILVALEGRASGEDAIRGDLERVVGSSVELSPEGVLQLRTLATAAEAVAAAEPYGSLLRAAASSAQDVASARFVHSDAARDAVYAAVLSPSTPASAREVPAFTRETSADIPESSLGATGEATTTVVALFANREKSVAWQETTGPQVIEPQDLLAHRSADGTLFWIGSARERYALRDATLEGWAFTTPMAAVVDAAEVGRWLAVFPVQVAR